MKTFFGGLLLASVLALAACAPGVGQMTGDGSNSGGHGVKKVAVDATGMPILGTNEEAVHGGTSAGGTPMVDIGGTGPYHPAPVSQTTQNSPVVIHDPAPAPAPEPTNTDFGAVSS